MDIKNMQKKAFDACKLEFIDLRGEDIITASTDYGFTTQENQDVFDVVDTPQNQDFLGDN